MRTENLAAVLLSPQGRGTGAPQTKPTRRHEADRIEEGTPAYLPSSERCEGFGDRRVVFLPSTDGQRLKICMVPAVGVTPT